MIHSILAGILQVMQHAPCTRLRTRTALIDLWTKNLSFKTKTSESLEGANKQHELFCADTAHFKADGKRLFMRFDMNASLPVNPWNLTIVCVTLVWECTFLDPVWLEVIYEKSNVTEQPQETKCFVLLCSPPLLVPVLSECSKHYDQWILGFPWSQIKLLHTIFNINHLGTHTVNTDGNLALVN